MPWKTSEQLRQNITALFAARKETPSQLAFALKKHRSWMTRFLNGERHELQLKDLDKIAEFFGVATYQLFQPGISALTERRRATERRSGRDRRVGHTQRAMLGTVAGELARVRSNGQTQHGETTTTPPDTRQRLKALVAEFDQRAAEILAPPKAKPRGQAAIDREERAEGTPGVRPVSRPRPRKA